MGFFDIHSIFFEIWGYSVSYLEFSGWIFGIIAVALSSLANVWSWPLGIVNVTLSFFLFFQVQLYPDMFLQVFFFITNVMGWWRWTHPGPGEEDKKNELKVSFLPCKKLLILSGTGLAGTVVFALFARNLHAILPAVFNKPSASPFLDSFITVMSIIATVYMIQKKIECWVIWILVDAVATYLYFVRDIKFYSLLYFVFCGIATYALWNWIREYKSYLVKT